MGNISFWLTLMMWIYWDRRSTEALIDASKVSLEINVKKTKYMLLSPHQNVGQNRNVKIVNRSFKNVSQRLRHLPTRFNDKMWLSNLSI
jgi:hypothetical protein